MSGDPAQELDKFRKRKDQFFQRDRHSPLTPDQRDGFSGLNYYPDNPDLRLKLPLDTFDDQEEVQMATSTGEVAQYYRWGKIRFEVEGEPAELTVFAAPGAGGFFLPFMDATSGGKTYGSGRYLEIEPAGDGVFLVDFNYAYNPYCAYNEMWSCPIPPKENRLKVPIRAGEKNFE